MNRKVIEQQANDAILCRLARHSVAIVNSIRTVGYDPVTKRPGDGEEVGSGFAGRWGSHDFILTAKHVLRKAEVGDLRLFCLPSGGVEYRAPADLRKQDIADALPLVDGNAVIHHCDWEDLSLITTTSHETVPNTEFFGMECSIDPPVGETVHCFGFPVDHSLVVDQKMIGPKEERTVAVYPTPFSTRVLPLPSEDERKFKITEFEEDRHYLVAYDDAAKGKHPGGISGAAVWWESDRPEIIWRPNFKFAGICVACYKGGSVMQVIKASVVARFLHELFGPADQQR